jgi:hypothetical protein
MARLARAVSILRHLLFVAEQVVEQNRFRSVLCIQTEPARTSNNILKDVGLNLDYSARVQAIQLSPWTT